MSIQEMFRAVSLTIMTACLFSIIPYHYYGDNEKANIIANSVVISSLVFVIFEMIH